MKIRVINESDWEKIYESDKSIIRVGSQISCDIQLKDSNIQPIHVQFNRSGGNDVRYTMRLFSDNVLITRGDQVFAGEQMVPYEILDGDKLTIGSYRMILTVEDEKTRVRTSPHIEAEMFLQKRDLSPDSPINGILKLKNIGTDKPCQFRLSITGIPNECLRSGPLPYLYPGGVSTVGFTISHLMTKPGPGFHTVSITLQAPEEYYGEVLEFNQDIYVVPVFKNELILEDDSEQLTGFNKTMQKEQKPSDHPEKVTESDIVRETARMIPGQAVNEEPAERQEKPPVIVSGETNRDAFSDGEEQDTDETRQRRRRKPEKVLVIHHDDELERNAFDDPAPADENASDEAGRRTPVSEPEAAGQPSPAAGSRPADDGESETKMPDRASRKRKKISARKKVADTERSEITEPEKADGSAGVSDMSDPDKDAAAAETVPAEDVTEIPEMTAADGAVSVPDDSGMRTAAENLPADSSPLPESGINDETVPDAAPEENGDLIASGAEPETAVAVPADGAADHVSAEKAFEEELREDRTDGITVPETLQPADGPAADVPDVSAQAQEAEQRETAPDASAQVQETEQSETAPDASAQVQETEQSETASDASTQAQEAEQRETAPDASAQVPETEQSETAPAEEEKLPDVSEEAVPLEPETVPTAAEKEENDVAEDAEELFKTIVQEEVSVVKHNDLDVPVVYGNQSFDFDDGSVPDEPSEDKPETVRFVKGDSFGD